MALNKYTIPSWLTDVREDATKSNVTNLLNIKK